MLGILLAPLPVEAALFGEFGLQEEMKMGREFEVLVKSSMPLIEDPEIQNYVQDIVDRIVETLPPQPYKFPAHVILHDSLNAFAAPGGFVFVFSGLMMQLHHESELAGVLSHEIAHVSQRHIASRMERGRVISLASLVGMIAGVAAGVAGGGNAGGAAIVGSMAAGSSAMLNYSRIDEDDADRFGMQYLVAAGYNPNGLGGAFEVLKAQDWSGSSSMPAYLSTHPDLNMRLSSIRADIQTMPEKWLSRKNDDERFRRIQTLLWARHGDPRAAVQFFDKLGKRSALSFMGKAMLAARQNRTKEAEILFAEALQASSQDELVLREAGIFEYSKGDMGKARRYLEQALKKTPRDYYALFYYARILDDSGDHTGAQERYREVLRYVPEDAEVHTYYGKSLGAAKRLSAGYLHLAYAALYSGQERRAAGWLDKAKKSARTDEDSRAVKRYEEKSKERARIMKEAR
jgi:predicted Zn-dependent protease